MPGGDVKLAVEYRFGRAREADTFKDQQKETRYSAIGTRTYPKMCRDTLEALLARFEPECS